MDSAKAVNTGKSLALNTYINKNENKPIILSTRKAGKKQ